MSYGSASEGDGQDRKNKTQNEGRQRAFSSEKNSCVDERKKQGQENMFFLPNAKQRIHDLESDLNKAKVKIAKHEEAIDRLEKHLTRLDEQSKRHAQQIESVVFDFVKQTEDPSPIYRPTSKRPQPYKLKQRFESMRDDYFSSLSRELIDKIDRDSQIFSDDRKVRIAQVHAILAEELLVKASLLLQNEDKSRKGEDDISGITCESVCSLLKEKGLSIQKEDDLKKIKQLSHDAAKLVLDMADAEPLGQLYWDSSKDKIEFDQSKHEPRLRTLPSGKVCLMFHPGYSENGKVVRKAFVITQSQI